jgi:hypothetical protein
MEDYRRLKEYFESNGLHFFTFHPKSVKPLKAVYQTPSVSHTHPRMIFPRAYRN